ncbi:MAG: glycosyltransferase family 2 protein [Bosea sp.]|nr:glycosyltransferase family 2 protein [Bosea sp. (in: a-proteobacteria)]
MSTTPYVSVIIPMFDRIGSIGRAIASVQAQTLNDFEIVVVDDGSSDGSPERVMAIDDPRISLIRRTQNGGASAARNSGIAAARGNLIAFLDSDDEWLPRKLEVQAARLAAAPEDAGVSCTGVEMHLLDHAITRQQPLEDTDDWARRLAMDCDLSPGTTQLTRRGIFDVIGPLDEKLPRFEDWDWLIRYTRRGRIVAVRDPLARVYNRRARLGDVVELSAMLLLVKHADVLAALSPSDRRQALADIWLQAAGTYAFEGKWSRMVGPAMTAFSHRPLHTIGRLAAGGLAVARGRAKFYVGRA